MASICQFCHFLNFYSTFRYYCATGKQPLFCPFWFLHSLFLPVSCDGKSHRGLYPRRLPSRDLFCPCYSDTSSGFGIKRCSLRTADSGYYFSDCHRSYGGPSAQGTADSRNPCFHSTPGALITKGGANERNTKLFSLDMLSCLWWKDPNKSLRGYDT